MFDEKMLQYSKKFGEGFPMIPLAWGRTEQQLIYIIDECLKKGKDVYQLGYVDDDENVIY